MASKKVLSASEIVETHKPKNFKYKYIFKDDEFLGELVTWIHSTQSKTIH